MSTRLSVNINDDTAAAIRQSAERRQTTATDTIRRAVSVYAFLVEAQERGDHIQLRDGKQITEVTILP